MKIPEKITMELRVRQARIVAVSNEMQLILDTYMATVEDDKVYRLSDDLTELIEVKEEVEEKEEDG